MKPEMLQTLKQIALFKQFNDQELWELLQTGRSTKADPYSNVVIEGEPSWGLYLVVSGKLQVFKSSDQDEQHYDLGYIESGGFFGEMSLIDEFPRSATVRAIEKSELICINKDSLEAFISRSVDRRVRFYESCARTLVVRLRQLDKEFVVNKYQLWKRALHQEKKGA